MKLEVGNYVRIQWGNGEQTISKCTNKVDIGNTQYSNNDFYIHTDKKGEVIYKSMILKSSNNIIDLIEVGDIIVDDFTLQPKKVSKVSSNDDYIYCNCDMEKISPECIKSIVTKEQFESMQYKVD